MRLIIISKQHTHHTTRKATQTQENTQIILDQACKPLLVSKYVVLTVVEGEEQTPEEVPPPPTLSKNELYLQYWVASPD